MENKKVLVTGAGGFLGSAIVNDFLKNGWEVVGLSRNQYKSLDDMNVRQIKCDLSNKEDVDLVDLSSFDAIVHTAALAGVWGDKEVYESINFHGSKNLIDKAIEDGVKYFIYTSSPSVVFGREDIHLGDETLEYPNRYYTDYARSKARAEKYILEKGKSDLICSLSLRPHLIWGPGDPHLIPRIVQKAKSGRLKQVGDGQNLVDIIFVHNASLAHYNALTSLMEKNELSGNAYFIGQEKPVNLWDFINQILAYKKIDPIHSEIGFSIAYALGFVFEGVFKFLGITSPEPPMTRFVAMQLAKSHYFSHEKAKNEINYNPVYSIDEGLKMTFADKNL